MTTTRYPTSSIVLHWTMAATIGAAWILAQVIDAVPRGPGRTMVLGSHVLVGLVVLALLLPRILARVTRGAPPPPPPPADVPTWQQRLASATHLLLYALMLAQPVSGIAYALSRSRPVDVLGLFALPVPLADSGLRRTLGGTHELLANLLLAVVVLHVAATVWHVFVKRDEVLQRMLPRRRRDGGAAIAAEERA